MSHCKDLLQTHFPKGQSAFPRFFHLRSSQTNNETGRIEGWLSTLSYTPAGYSGIATHYYIPPKGRRIEDANIGYTVRCAAVQELICALRDTPFLLRNTPPLAVRGQRIVRTFRVAFTTPQADLPRIFDCFSATNEAGGTWDAVSYPGLVVDASQGRVENPVFSVSQMDYYVTRLLHSITPRDVFAYSEA